MQSTAIKKTSYLYEVTIKESGAEFEKARSRAIEDIRSNGKVKGFKKGSNIPDAVILREYGEDRINERALDMIMNKIYPKVLKKEQIAPIAPAQITAVKSTTPLEIVVEIEVMPTVEIDEKKIAKVSVKATKVEVTESEVEAELDGIRSRFTHFHTAGSHTDDGADTSHTTIEKGDRVTVSAQGYEKKGGEAIPQTTVPSYPLVIGSGTFIPGFEDHLIGTQSGEHVAFDITFPADYHSEEFQNREVHFTVDIEKVEKPHTPEFTPDFIESLRGKRIDLAGFRELLRAELLEKKEHEARAKDEDALMKQFLEIISIEAGPELMSREIDRVYSEQSANLEQQGFKMKDYLQHIQKDEANYKEEIVQPEALRRLQAELILRELRTLKQVEVSDEEVNTEVEKMITLYSTPEVLDRLRAKLVPGDGYYEDIRNRLAYKKTVDLFLK